MINICWYISNHGDTTNSIYNVYIIQMLCGVRFQFQKINSILAKLLLLNKASDTVQPALADPVYDSLTNSLDILDLKLIQIVLTTMALTFTCYLFMRLILWTYDFLNTKFLHINSTGLTYWKTLIIDKTNIFCSVFLHSVHASLCCHCSILKLGFRWYVGVLVPM